MKNIPVKKHSNKQKIISFSYTSVRHSQSNPVQRYIQEIMKSLMNMIWWTLYHHIFWDQNLKNIKFYLNISANTVTEESPIYLIKGVNPERKWTIQGQKQ